MDLDDLFFDGHDSDGENESNAITNSSQYGQATERKRFVPPTLTKKAFGPLASKFISKNKHGMAPNKKVPMSPSSQPMCLTQAFRPPKDSQMPVSEAIGATQGKSCKVKTSEPRKTQPAFRVSQGAPKIGVVAPSLPVFTENNTEKDEDDIQNWFPDLPEGGSQFSPPPSGGNLNQFTQTPMTQSLVVPALTPGGTDQGIQRLKSIRELPEKYREIFKFPYFNIVQSKVFDEIMYGDKHVVLGAPTGCGKTVALELAILRLIMTRSENGILPTTVKTVYMAPMKALCSERFQDWCAKLHPLGLKCQELTGETLMDDYYDIQDVHIILTTPEKWDSMTRRWRDNHSLVRQVSLFLIDEVHLLNDSSRGATMEAVISRMKTIQSVPIPSSKNNAASIRQAKLRFVAISATVPNHEDVADWLKYQGQESLHYSFDDGCRPVRLRKVVLGFPCSADQSEFRFDLSLNYKLASVIETYSDQRPTLVFCATRKSVQQGASILVKEARFLMAGEHKQKLVASANTLKDNKLREVVMCGVGFHHAGLDAQDRKTIEGLFAEASLPVLLATSTLAMGVNLPAHLVVIKSTMHYVMGVYQEYAESQILQMIGRAGRPQFDTTATAVIMTRLNTKNKYENMLNGTQLIESSLHENLVEHINAEIVLSTITDVAVAVDWLRSTFLYTRVMKNPRHYGIPTGLTKEQVEKKLQDMCLKAVNALSDVGLLEMDEDGFLLKPTELGKLMARYCVAFNTMKQFQALGPTESLETLLTSLCNSQEFREVQLRNNEKTVLNSLNKHKNKITIRFPMNGKIKSNEMKVNCLIQAQLGCLPFQEFALAQDTTKIFRSAVRICKCLVEVLWQKSDFQSLLSAVLLAKCLRAKLWENSRYVTRQLPGIGPTMSNALVNAGVISFQKVEERNPRDLELIVNRHPPFGNQMKDSVNKLPKYELCIDQSTMYKEKTADISISVSLMNRDAVRGARDPTKRFNTCMLLIGDADNNVVLKTRISDSALLQSDQWSKRLEIKRASNGESLSVNLIHEDLVGLDVQTTYTPFYAGPKRVSNAFRGSMNQETPPISTIQKTPKPTLEFVQKQDGKVRRQCDHHCLDKQSCAHDCCKTGVVIKPRAGPARKNCVERFCDDIKKKLSTMPTTPSAKRLKPTTPSLKTTSLDKFIFTTQRKPRLSHNQSLAGQDEEVIISDDSANFDVEFNLDDDAWQNSGHLEQEPTDNYSNRMAQSYTPVPERCQNNYDRQNQFWYPQDHAAHPISLQHFVDARNPSFPDPDGYFDDLLDTGDFGNNDESAMSNASFRLNTVNDSDELPDLYVPKKRQVRGATSGNNPRTLGFGGQATRVFSSVGNNAFSPQSSANRSEQTINNRSATSPASQSYYMTRVPANQKRRIELPTNQHSPFRHMTNSPANHRSPFPHVTRTPAKKSRLVGIACRTPKIRPENSPEVDIFNSPLPGTITGPFAEDHTEHEASRTADNVMMEYNMSDLESPRVTARPCGYAGQAEMCRNKNTATRTGIRPDYKGSIPRNQARNNSTAKYGITDPGFANANSSTRPMSNTARNPSFGRRIDGSFKAHDSTYQEKRYASKGADNFSMKQSQVNSRNNNDISQAIPYNKHAWPQNRQGNHLPQNPRGGSTSTDDVMMLDDDVTEALGMLEEDSDFEEEQLLQFNSPQIRNAKKLASMSFWNNDEENICFSPLSNVSQLSSPVVQPTCPTTVKETSVAPQSMFCLPSKETGTHDEDFDEMLGDLLKDCVKKD